ncbi:MAG: SCO family protein [Kouleothrix sp.]|nr:SCO family protein [Kouleothrix sp.]
MSYRTAGAVAGLLALLVALCAPAAARADGGSDDLLGQVGFDQRLGAQVAPELAFRDEDGAAVRLGNYLGARPVILVLAYYRCPNICSIALHQLSDTLRQISFGAGQQYDVVAVSIDPGERPADASAKKAEIVQSYGRPDEAGGWHFLTGPPESIHALAAAVGFRYAYDPQQHQFAHPTGSILLTPQGNVSRYFYGIDYAPTDLRLGLVEASSGRIGSPVDLLLLRCYHYDPVTGKYDIAIMSVLRLAGVATALLLGATVLALFRLERRRAARHDSGLT